MNFAFVGDWIEKRKTEKLRERRRKFVRGALTVTAVLAAAASAAYGIVKLVRHLENTKQQRTQKIAELKEWFKSICPLCKEDDIFYTDDCDSDFEQTYFAEDGQNGNEI